MKFLETCILALLLITQQILADGAGAADTDATDSLEQYDGNSRSDIIAQEIKRARIPQFVGKRDYFANDDLDLSDDGQDIPIEVKQALERDLLTSLLAGSTEDLPDGSESDTQNDFFDRQTRYRPMMVGRRGKWAPKFVGKRRGPLFVGRRRSPYFVGKRTLQTESNMAAEKRRNPMFVGKRADPVLVARGLSKPMFVGRRGHPMFVGRRTASGDLDSSIFMGKRSVQNLETGQGLTGRKKRSVDRDKRFAINTATIKTLNKHKARQRSNPTVIRKRTMYSKLDRRKRESDIVVDKDRRNFDAPYFVGKRESNDFGKASTDALLFQLFNEFPTVKTPNSEPPTALGKRGREFHIPDFVGKRTKVKPVSPKFLSKQTTSRSHSLNDFPSNNNKPASRLRNKRYNPPDFIGKRYGTLRSQDKRYRPPDFIGKRYSSPDFIGKRHSPPDFIGKRYSPPDFIGKRYNPPYFVGKRYSPPDFIGKRYSPPDFIGKRYSPPDFIGKRYSPPDFIGKRYSPLDFIGKRYSPSDFIGKRYGPLNFAGKRYSRADVVGSSESKRDLGFISPYFIGKRDTIFTFPTFNGLSQDSKLHDKDEKNNIFDEQPQRQVNAAKSIYQFSPRIYFPLLKDTKLDAGNEESTSQTPRQLDNAVYPEVTEFSPATDGDQEDESDVSINPTRLNGPGILRKRSSEVIRQEREITFTPPDFIGKRDNSEPADEDMEFMSESSFEKFNFPGYQMNLDKSELYTDIARRLTSSFSKFPAGSLSQTPSLNLNFLPSFSFWRSASFVQPNLVRIPAMHSGYLQSDSYDANLAASTDLPSPNRLQRIILQPKQQAMSLQHSVIDNGGTNSDGFSDSFLSDYAADSSVDRYGNIPERT